MEMTQVKFPIWIGYLIFYLSITVAVIMVSGKKITCKYETIQNE